MEYFSSTSAMDVSSQGSGEESDVSEQYVPRSRWHVRGSKSRGRRVTVRARSGRIGRRDRRRVGTRLSSRGHRGRRGSRQRLSSRGHIGRPVNPGSSSSTHLSAAALAVLNEIGSVVWKNEEPQSFTQQYILTPGPTSPDVTGDSTPVELFCRFFLMMFGT